MSVARRERRLLEHDAVAFEVEVDATVVGLDALVGPAQADGLAARVSRQKRLRDGAATGDRDLQRAVDVEPRHAGEPREPAQVGEVDVARQGKRRVARQAPLAVALREPGVERRLDAAEPSSDRGDARAHAVGDDVRFDLELLGIDVEARLGEEADVARLAE